MGALVRKRKLMGLPSSRPPTHSYLVALQKTAWCTRESIHAKPRIPPAHLQAPSAITTGLAPCALVTPNYGLPLCPADGSPQRHQPAKPQQHPCRAVHGPPCQAQHCAQPHPGSSALRQSQARRAQSRLRPASHRPSSGRGQQQRRRMQQQGALQGSSRNLPAGGTFIVQVAGIIMWASNTPATAHAPSQCCVEFSHLPQQRPML